MSPSDEYGTPLHDAAQENDAALVDRLIDEGADVGLAVRGGWTPLHMAAEYSSVEAARRGLAELLGDHDIAQLFQKGPRR